MTTPPFTLTVPFDRRFLWRALRRDHAWILLYAVVIYVILMVLLAWALGESRWLVGLPIGVVLLGLVFFLRLRTAVRRTHELWLKQSPSRTVRYLVDAEGLTIDMDHAQSRYAWKDLRRLWCYSDVWLFEIVRMQSVPFPPREAPKEMKAFILDCCRAAGVRV
jgi:hypothetical protein